VLGKVGSENSDQSATFTYLQDLNTLSTINLPEFEETVTITAIHIDPELDEKEGNDE
jgi:hypothetical protein